MSHELPSQSDPVSPDEIAEREAQAESVMGLKEAEPARVRESWIEDLRDKVGLGGEIFDEVVSSMSFSDLDRRFEFKVRGHKISGKLERVKFELAKDGSEDDYKSNVGDYSEIAEVFVDDVKIELWTGLDKFVERYKKVILGLRNIPDDRVVDDVERSHRNQVRNLVDEITK